jgi:MarR family transcriptional regulator, organic hydroperoxide resistance regulator
MDFKNTSLEEIIFQFIDQCKILFFPEQWNQTFLDYSKNEAFTLLLIYRKGQVNMTEIAEHLMVPLNTVTGIVSRLEKRGVIIRERDKDDKRIVVVTMSPAGTDMVKGQIESLGYYFERIMTKLSEEELSLLMKIAGDIFAVFRNKETSENSSNMNKVKRIPIE